MPYTDKQVHDELKKHGITTLDELAKKVAEQSAAKAKSGAEADYLWSGKNFSIWHPELSSEPISKK
jgi:hypothetical protein